MRIFMELFYRLVQNMMILFMGLIISLYFNYWGLIVAPFWLGHIFYAFKNRLYPKGKYTTISEVFSYNVLVRLILMVLFYLIIVYIIL